MAGRKLSPLEIFDARLVQVPMCGLLRNMDAELVRLHKQAMTLRDSEAERKLSLLLVMLRFTRNSYEAMSFLCSDAGDTPKRKREFVLILPPANRQLLDLLFTLVFMLDDFSARSMAYELSGYREAREVYDRFYNRFGADPKWQEHFADHRQLLQMMEKYLSLTSEQRANPLLIPYWPAPYKLMKRASTSQPFMKFLDQWLYGETSAQAHLNAAGLFAVGGFLIPELAPGDIRKIIEERNFEKYKFRHFSRSLITVLAIASEIDNFCQLKNRETLTRLWVLLAGYAEEAADVYKLRYQAMLA